MTIYPYVITYTRNLVLRLFKKERDPRMNQFKTFLLMLVMTLLFVLVGSAVGGKNGVVYAFIFAGLMNFFAYWFSDKIVLRMYGAKEVSQGEAPELYGIVAELTSKASLPMPKVYIMENDTPNAFATGRNPEHAAVAVTTGILKILSKEELMGVIGHELSPCEEPRYPCEHGGSHPGRCHCHACANGSIWSDVWRRSIQ